MGIPKYHKWLTERYPSAFSEAQHERADHVYVDVNALLHDCMRHAASEEEFFHSLFSKFDSLFRIVSPGRSVFLAVDGPASCAKCLTQRQRRRAHAQRDAKNNKSSSGWKGKGKGKSGSSEKLSNNMLTPGVPFMTKLTSALEYYAASRMKTNQPFARCESVTVSGARAIGEGEHKIVSQMLRNAGAAGDLGVSESHVIFSGDADIFLLSLVQSACRKVRVVSERPHDQNSHGRKRKGVMLQIWNAEVLASCIQKELITSACGSSEESALRRDFALVSLFAGNDYLPPLACSLTPQRLWEQYLSLRRKKFPRTPLLVTEPAPESLPLSHLEGGWALEVGERGAAFGVEPYEQFAFHEPLLFDLMQAACGGSTADSLTERQAEGVQKYLEGLLWILEMYHHGYCADFYFVMQKSFHSCANAFLVVSYLANARATQEPLELAAPRSELPPMRPMTCAICVLPVKDAEKFLCPSVPELRPMFASTHPLLGAVNSLERNEALQEYRTKVSALQQEMMSLRSLGRDDTKVKSMLTATQQAMEEIKKGGSDIDVVPLWEVDAEVFELCPDKEVLGLSFASDVTLARSVVAVDAIVLQAPARGMLPVSCAGLKYVHGEWPETSDVEVCDGGDTGEGVVGASDDDYACSAHGEAHEDAIEVLGDDETFFDQFSVGDTAEGYWPDDDTWLVVTIHELHSDGSVSIVWDDDSQSTVPHDYIRPLRDDAIEPPMKRSRL